MLCLIFKQLGYIPYIIGTTNRKSDNEFLKRKVNLKIIHNSFKEEIKLNDYDILMVNSNQTWRKFDRHIFDYGFLEFAKNWKIKKFIYGASIGFDFWKFSPKEDKEIKLLLKGFSGISVREKGSIPLIKEHLGITPENVLDPVLLLDKKYYLELIKNYKYDNDDSFIFVYQIMGLSKNFEKCLQLVKSTSHFKIKKFELKSNYLIERFISQIYNSKAVITHSFNGTVLSIIFNKPFIAFNQNSNRKERLTSLGKLFGVESRIFSFRKT